MQNDLTSVEWREFKIGKIFDIVNSKAYHKTKLKIKDGTIPYITRTSFNNGLECFIINENFKLNPKNSISFGAENADFFYQGQEYITGNKMYFLQNKNINRYIGLFLVKILQGSIKNCGFGYGKGLTGTRLKNRTLILPIDSKGSPNWQFMENYMKNIEQKYINNIVIYYKKLASSYGETISIDEYKELYQVKKLKDIQWKEFGFDFIFKEIKRGKRLIKDNQFQGKTPYVSSSALNNGVDNFINNSENIRKFSNCISLANSGSVGSAFFHSYEFVASDHVTQLIQPKFSKYVYLFLLPIIARLSEKYSFNREINDKRINREKLLLPIDSKGNPDYAFMESYMRVIEKKHLDKIRAFYCSKIA